MYDYYQNYDYLEENRLKMKNDVLTYYKGYLKKNGKGLMLKGVGGAIMMFLNLLFFLILLPWDAMNTFFMLILLFLIALLFFVIGAISSASFIKAIDKDNMPRVERGVLNAPLKKLAHIYVHLYRDNLPELERALYFPRTSFEKKAVKILKRDNIYESLVNYLKTWRAIDYEKAMNYEEAVKIYEELGMWEDARRCRELLARERGRLMPAYPMERREYHPVARKMERVGVREIKEIYGLKEESEEEEYRWGEFSEYRIVRRIGSGGFSDVYIVERNEMKYAMKMPKGVDLKGEETLLLKKEEIKSYGKEAEIWALLTERISNAVVNLIDAGIHPFPWFVMELGDKSLRNEMQRLSYEEKIKIAIGLLGKLDKIHHFGVVHKDIKPENILYASGQWKFTDFGLSKILSKSSKSSQMISGTLLYMAPEQISHKKFGHTDWRTDIWQVGVLIYELLTGHLPFEAEDAGELAMNIIMDSPTPATDYGVSEEIWRVIEKALMKKKDERWQSAAEMKRALEEAT